MQAIGTIFGYIYVGCLAIGGLFLAYELLFKRKPVIENRGWNPEGRVLRRDDRNIVYEGDSDDPVANRRRASDRRFTAALRWLTLLHS